MSVRTTTLTNTALLERPSHGRHDPARLYSGIRALLNDACVEYDALVAYVDEQGATQIVSGRAVGLETVNGADQIRFDDGFSVPLAAVVAFATEL